MRIELFVSATYEPCREAERVWRELAGQRGLDLTVVDIDDATGGERARTLGIKMVPALVVNERLLAIGVQTAHEARDLIADQR